jgi:hypothetical protein
MIRSGTLIAGVFLGALSALAACAVGPSEQRLGCLNGCAHEKDSCVLNAMTPDGIQACDARARACSAPCPQ